MVMRKNSTWAYFAPIRRAVVAMALGVWRLGVANTHRRDLARLAGADDRMLADIGLKRSDLRDARSEPLWKDPTKLLAHRAGERGNNVR
jgi:uncharacterized protein YjiS (DUF1127 family)